jgi:catechol 2,3-dioxygenase
MAPGRKRGNHDAPELHVPRIFSAYLQVRDLDRSLSFYQDILGLDVDHNDGILAILRSRGDSGHTLVLRQIGDHPRHGPGKVGVTRLAFRVTGSADLDRAEELLTRHQMPYHRGQIAGADYLTTRDPDGLRIVLLQTDQASMLDAAPPAPIYWPE